MVERMEGFEADLNWDPFTYYFVTSHCVFLYGLKMTHCVNEGMQTGLVITHPPHTPCQQ